MKKNLISVLILAVGVANLVLTALLVFSILPQTQKANKLISEVCSAIDLELNSGAASGPSDVPIENIETYKLNGGENMNMNLKSEKAGESHYAIIAVSLSLNTKSDNYKTYSPEVISAKEDLIKNDIIRIVGTYTLSEITSDPQAVQDEILAKIQEYFGKDYIVGVNFSNMQTQ